MYKKLLALFCALASLFRSAYTEGMYPTTDPAAPPLVDTHCHLDYCLRPAEPSSEENPPDTLSSTATTFLNEAKSVGVRFLVNPCVHPQHYQEVITLAEAHQEVYAAVAIHPTDVSVTTTLPNWLEHIETLLKHPKTVAIGETGLDYYWDTSTMTLQKDCFLSLLALGRSHNLPVIVHDRDAHEDVYQTIRQVPGVRGIMHCFSGDAAFAAKMIDLGFAISFAGNLTFKNAKMLQEAAQAVPLEHILIETDTPFLSPMPFRGKPNTPSRVKLVAEKLAELKNIPYETVATVTSQNACRVFGLPETLLAG